MTEALRLEWDEEAKTLYIAVPHMEYDPATGTPLSDWRKVPRLYMYSGSLKKADGAIEQLQAPPFVAVPPDEEDEVFAYLRVYRRNLEG